MSISCPTVRDHSNKTKSSLLLFASNFVNLLFLKCASKTNFTRPLAKSHFKKTAVLWPRRWWNEKRIWKTEQEKEQTQSSFQAELISIGFALLYNGSSTSIKCVRFKSRICRMACEKRKSRNILHLQQYMKSVLIPTKF